VLGDGMEFVEVVFSIFDISGQSEQGEAAYSCAEVRRLDGADILLV
jgi:hypothetical protein